MPSEIEVLNASKVLEMLNNIEGVSFEQVREDIFTVTEYDSDMGLTAVVDVEEETVVCMVEICELRECEGDRTELLSMLLKANNDAVHGAFAITPDNKIIIKDVLEIQNLDQNELEASLGNILGLALTNIEKIAGAVN